VGVAKRPRERSPTRNPYVTIRNFAIAVGHLTRRHFSSLSRQAGARAFKGGVAGFTAGVFQVFAFMWLRTCMNYQYVNGGNLRSALRYRTPPRASLHRGGATRCKGRATRT
jgi:hypothetical protein